MIQKTQLSATLAQHQVNVSCIPGEYPTPNHVSAWPRLSELILRSHVCEQASQKTRNILFNDGPVSQKGTTIDSSLGQCIMFDWTIYREYILIGEKYQTHNSGVIIIIYVINMWYKHIYLL